MRYLSVMAILLTVALPPSLTMAQGEFSPAIRVNDAAITPYEIEQRARLLRTLGAARNADSEARDVLIEERLQVAAANDLGITATEADVADALDELAARGNLTADEFVARLEDGGVARQSIETFVTAGVLWREVIRARFGPRAQVSEADVDRAVALAGRTGGARVLISEIVLPARTSEERAANRARAEGFAELRSTAAFSQAARDFSAAPTRADGGQVDWLDLATLPPELRTEFLTLAPGGVTTPLELPNAVAVFQLRALEELPPQAPQTLAIDYAEFRIPDGDRRTAGQVLAVIDTCDDLFGVAEGLPEERLFRDVRPVAEIPRDVALALARLDTDETAVLTRPGGQSVVMLCGRTSALTAELDRGQIRSQLLSQRLQSYAEGFLAELRADAVIQELQ